MKHAGPLKSAVLLVACGALLYVGSDGNLRQTALLVGVAAVGLLVQHFTRAVAAWKAHTAFGAALAIGAATFGVVEWNAGSASTLDLAVLGIVTACAIAIVVVSLVQRDTARSEDRRAAA